MKTVRVAAMDYLARRDHARVELQRKLLQKGYALEEIDQALDRLQEQGLQCDRRFAHSYAQYRAQSGHGPLKIKLELKQHGVSEELIAQVMAQLDVDWQALAQALFEKKFGRHKTTDLKERARQQRFMLQRGFDPHGLNFVTIP